MHLPWNVTSKVVSPLMLWRLPDENFRIMQVGEMPVLISGYQHILVHQSILQPFLELDSDQVKAYPRSITRQMTHQCWTSYWELKTAHSITPHTIKEITNSQIHIWAYQGQCLFVSTPFKTALEKLSDQLAFSEGFSHFA